MPEYWLTDYLRKRKCSPSKYRYKKILRLSGCTCMLFQTDRYSSSYSIGLILKKTFWWRVRPFVFLTMKMDASLWKEILDGGQSNNKTFDGFSIEKVADSEKGRC